MNNNVRLGIRPMAPKDNKRKLTELSYIATEANAKVLHSYDTELSLHFIEGGIAMKFKRGMSPTDVAHELRHAAELLERRS